MQPDNGPAKPRVDPDELREVCGSTADENATRLLVEIMYPELKRIAQMHMRRERWDHTWQPTALVSEVFLKLSRNAEIQWRDRSHFLIAASKAMRLLLIDHARTRKAEKNGGGLCKVHLDTIEATGGEPAGKAPNVEIEYMDLHDLLRKLAVIDKRMADVVELKVFGGLTFSEIGEVVGVHERTVKRDWQVARAWLYGQLRGGEDVGGGVGTD